MSKEKKQLLPDKKNAPKKTGKKGIGPLDPVKDFENPLNKKAIEETRGSFLVKQPLRPTVVGNRFEAFFLKTTFSKTKEGRKLVSLRFTVPLEDEHIDVLPKIVADGYKDVKKKGRNKIGFNGIPGQSVHLHLSQDIKEDVLAMPAAKFLNSRIDIIERKGEGEVRKVIRLGFTLQVEQSHEVRNFATENHGNTFWLNMADTEEELFDEDDSEAAD